MIKIIKIARITAVATIGILLAFAMGSSCTRDTDLDLDGGTGLASGEFTKMSVELVTPGEFVPAVDRGTRALTVAQQNAVLKAVVLQFKDNIMVHHAVATVAAAGGGNGGNTVTVKAVLKSSHAMDELFDILVLANPDTMTVARFVGKTKEEVKAGLTFAMQPNPTNDNWAVKGLPMWGEATSLLVKPTINSMKITLLRALATIDIGLGKYNQLGNSWDGLTEFKLTDLYVMNINDRAAAIPTAITLSEQGAITAAEPSIPMGSNLLGTTPITALNYSNSISTQKQCTSSIFVSEVDNATTTDKNKRLILIIGGRYNGSSVTYYRLDMVPPADTKPLNVLRNHAYRFSIIGVSGAGQTSVAAAYEAGPSLQTKIELTPWNQGDTGDIIFNSNYYLTTDISELQIYSKPDGIKEYEIATVKATFPTGAIANVVGPGVDVTLVNATPTAIKVVLPWQGNATNYYYTYKITAGTLTKNITLRVLGPIDAHFDLLPMINVESLIFSESTPWVSMSTDRVYNKDKQIFGGIVSNPNGNKKLYLHFDENINTTGTSRIAQATLRRNTNQTTTRLLIEQLAPTVVGYFSGERGGNDIDGYGYTTLTVMENVGEYQQVYEDPDMGLPVSGLPWGYTYVEVVDYGCPKSNTASPWHDKPSGKEVTINLATNANGYDTGITPPYTIRNNFAARYCYDKNRDTNGDNIISKEEVLWYLPSERQALAMHMAEPVLTDFWCTAVSYEQDNNWSNSIRSIGSTMLLQRTRTTPIGVRCLRDIE